MPTGPRTEGFRTLAGVAGGMAETEAPASADADGDPDPGESETEDGTQRVFTDRAKLGIAIAVTGIVTTGLFDNLLTQRGAPGAGALVWALGFATTVGILWYVLLRPLDIGAR